MYGYEQQPFHSKDPDKLTEEEAKQALMYWRGKYDALNEFHTVNNRLSNLEATIYDPKNKN